MLERDLQKQCNELLRVLNIPFFHIEKGRSLNKWHRQGFPDLMFIVNGKFYMVELKKTDGVISDKQLEILRHWGSYGAQCHVCFSFEAFEGLLKREKIIA